VNTPERPLEASGTSGMKAAVNAIPSLSTLDGWWVEGHIEDGTGWAIEENDSIDAVTSLYRKLEHRIIPMFYERPHQYLAVMRQTVALNGSFFNSQRMLDQYIRGAYFASNPLHRSPALNTRAG
jgi:starch phosphorylase